MQRGKAWLAVAILAIVALATIAISTSACTTIWSSQAASSAPGATTTRPVAIGANEGVPIPAVDSPSYATTKSLPSMGFWGVWGPADRSESKVRPVADKLRASGFEAGIVYTPEWTRLSLSPWYIVCIGPYSNKATALKALKAAQYRGYKGFHVDFSGPTSMDQGADWVKSGARI